MRVAASQQDEASSQAQAIALTPGGLVTLGAQHAPASVQSVLRAPCDFDHAEVLARLAASSPGADRRTTALVVGGFEEQSTGVP